MMQIRRFFSAGKINLHLANVIVVRNGQCVKFLRVSGTGREHDALSGGDTAQDETRSPTPEIRMKPQAPNPKINVGSSSFGFLVSVIHSDFGFGASGFDEQRLHDDKFFNHDPLSDQPASSTASIFIGSPPLALAGQMPVMSHKNPFVRTIHPERQNLRDRSKGVRPAVDRYGSNGLLEGAWNAMCNDRVGW
jgi:hypothetical protein